MDRKFHFVYIVLYQRKSLINKLTQLHIIWVLHIRWFNTFFPLLFIYHLHSCCYYYLCISWSTTLWMRPNPPHNIIILIILFCVWSNTALLFLNLFILLHTTCKQWLSERACYFHTSKTSCWHFMFWYIMLSLLFDRTIDHRADDGSLLLPAADTTIFFCFWLFHFHKSFLFIWLMRGGILSNRIWWVA